MLAQDGRRTERRTPRTLALRRDFGIDLLDQPRDQGPIHLRAEVAPAGKLRELDDLFCRMAPGLEGFSPQFGPVLLSPIEPRRSAGTCWAPSPVK